MAKELILNSEVFDDPKRLGQAEYNAIYDLLESTTMQANDEKTSQEETDSLLKSIIEEFKDTATAMLKRLETEPATIEEGED